ncbi:MAG: hypothetical protein ACMUJM_19425 [bacterium]
MIPSHKYSAKNEEGTVLIIAVTLLGVLTLLGIYTIINTNTDLKNVGLLKMDENAFYAAEAGIEAGRAALNELKETDKGAWDILLVQQNDPDIHEPQNLLDSIDQSVLDFGSFTLSVVDNDDLDGDPLVDTDNIIYLTSTGRYGIARITIEALVRYRGKGEEYAQEHYGTDNYGYAEGEDTAPVDNERW